MFRYFEFFYILSLKYFRQGLKTVLQIDTTKKVNVLNFPNLHPVAKSTCFVGTFKAMSKRVKPNIQQL